MAFITNNANLILLLLIVISATTLVAATVYFQSNFERLNVQYTDKLSKLNAVSKDLEDKQAALARIESELSLKSARESDITSKYTEIRESKDTLEKTNVQLQQDHDAKKEELKKKESVIKTMDDTIKDRDNKIANLQGGINEIQRQFDDINFKYVKIKQDACQNYNATKYC